LQINGRTCEVLRPTPLSDRYAAFGWSVKVVDGHDVEALYNAFASAPFEAGKPSMVIARTKKGRGLSFCEDNVKYHHWNPGQEEAEKALAEMKEAGKRWCK
jgi:transketolase